MSDASLAPRIETFGLGAWWMRALVSLVLALLVAVPPHARAQNVDVVTLAAARGNHGIELDFVLRFSLPPAVEDALRRGIPLHFVARATVLRPRWYWRDERVARAIRSWRLSYQPLTSSWRISQGGLNQTYDTLSEALQVMARASRWQIADAARTEPDENYYIEFSWGLDTAQLPRPMQIGIGGQAGWALSVERTLALD